MKKDLDTLLSLIIIVLFGWFVVWCVTTLPRKGCEKRWSSFENRWAFYQGCQIMVDGKWIPAESYYYKEGN